MLLFIPVMPFLHSLRMPPLQDACYGNRTVFHRSAVMPFIAAIKYTRPLQRLPPIRALHCMTTTANHPRIHWLVALVLSFGTASIGGSLTVLDDWYYGLQQPWFKPPDFLFGPVWTTLFFLMAWSGVLAWRTHASDPVATAQRQRLLLQLWAFNGIANIAWSWLYFYLQRPAWALLEMPVLWLSIWLLIRHLTPYHRKAALMLWPYLAWVSFAAALNVATVVLNPA
jgi:benzodiazapine receptor